jgi:hypothetical protein
MRPLLAAVVVQAQEQVQVLMGSAQGPRRQVMVEEVPFTPALLRNRSSSSSSSLLVQQVPMVLEDLLREATVAAMQKQQVPVAAMAAMAAAMAAMSATLAAIPAALASLRHRAYRSGMQGAWGSRAHQTPLSGVQHQVRHPVLDPSSLSEKV